MFNYSVVKNCNKVTVSTIGVIDTDTAPKLGEALLELDYSDLDLTFDFNETEYITSAGLRVLLVARKKLSNETMRIINVNDSIEEVFRISGFSDILNYSKKQDTRANCRLSFKELQKKRISDIPAYVYLNKEYTWKDVEIYSQIIADDLAKIGVKKGSHVGICSMNSINWIFTFFALQKLGAIAVLVNFGLKPNEVASLAEIGDITHLCYGEIPGMTSFDMYSSLLLDGKSYIQYMYNISTSINFETRVSEYEAIKDKYAEVFHPDDPSVVIFTSGSTGKPKAVLLSSYNLLNSIYSTSVQTGLTKDDRICAFLPFFHIFGFGSSISIPLLFGPLVCIPESSKPDTLIRIIDEYKCTIFNTVPTMMFAIIQHPNFTPAKLSTLRSSALGGAATSETQMKMLQNLLPNNHFTNVYGMSENAIISCTKYIDTIEHMTQTVGCPAEGIEIEIRDITTGKKVPNGQPGEICIRSKEMIVCYYHLPIEKQPLDDEGWLATGDLGLILPDGYLKLVGRAKDLIIRGGENISPSEVAEAMSQFDEIADVKVIGVPHEILGEEVCAVIILKDGATFDAENAKQVLLTKIAKFKVPAHFVIVDKFPLLGSGKIDAITLKKDVMTKLGIKGE